MESFSTALLLLIAISVVLLVYVIYIFFDQRSNLRFASPKSKWAPLIALVLIVIGFGNYFYNGQRTEDLGAAFVLVIFALMMAIGRSGIGESGLYIEGIKMSWKQINKASVKNEKGKVVLTYTRRKGQRTLELADTTVEEVEEYLRKKRRIYHFGK